MISLLLFFSYLSARIRIVVRKYHGCSDSADRSVDGIENSFSCSPLLYHDHWPVSKFRDGSTKLLSRINRVLRFEDTKHKKTCMPSLSGLKGGVHKMPSELLRLHNAILTVTLVVLFVYYTEFI
jgi:hypothetical protein